MFYVVSYAWSWSPGDALGPVSHTSPWSTEGLPAVRPWSASSAVSLVRDTQSRKKMREYSFPSLKCCRLKTVPGTKTKNVNAYWIWVLGYEIVLEGGVLLLGLRNSNESGHWDNLESALLFEPFNHSWAIPAWLLMAGDYCLNLHCWPPTRDIFSLLWKCCSYKSMPLWI